MSVEEDIGYIKGTLDSLKEDNNKDHIEIKEGITRGGERIQLLCGEFNDLHRRLGSHEKAIVDLDGRVSNVERRQKYLDRVGKFIMDHPKLTLFLFVTSALLLSGYTLEQIIKFFT